MSELFGDRKAILKELIRALHSGANPDEMKGRFEEALKGTSPTEIAQIEEELIKEGMPREEVQRLCDVHLAVFREPLEKQKIEVPPTHPISILLKEHEFVKKALQEISQLVSAFEQGEDFGESELTKIKELLGHLKEYEKHKVREENSLFPYLEKHGVTQPPAIMWAEHDEQRREIKEAGKTLENREKIGLEESRGGLISQLKKLTDLIPSHFYKEENILYPTALRLINDSEWQEIKASMDDLGYCYFTPKEAIGQKVELVEEIKQPGREIILETGSMTREELETVLNTLPVDLTFVDAEDTVRYFSQSKERIFPRAKAVIGRKVQQCHPQASVHKVNQILDDFRSGQSDVAEFWIQLKERLIDIRYFALRGKNKEYLGCLEVAQNITDIKKIEGEEKL